MYEIGKMRLLNLLDDLFGKPLTDDEFTFHDMVLGEMENWLIIDGYLTREEILEIEDGWRRPAVA